MICVTVAQPDNQTWREWLAEARIETERAVKSRGQKTYKISEELYKRPRRFLLRAFHDKCGYCETKIDAPDRHGDLDHFRPKRRVTNEDRSVVLVLGAENKYRPHPGYYWLVYEWTNLIPSCSACNRPGEDRDELNSGEWDI